MTRHKSSKSKFKPAIFAAHRQRLTTILSPEIFVWLMRSLVPRQRLERLALQAGKGAVLSFAQFDDEQFLLFLCKAFLLNNELCFLLMRELDKVAGDYVSAVADADLQQCQDLLDRASSRQQAARLVWSLLRDVRTKLNQMVVDYFPGLQKKSWPHHVAAQEIRQAASALPGIVPPQQKPEKKQSPLVSAPVISATDEEQRARLRRLQKQLDAITRERDRLVQIENKVQEVEQNNQSLRSMIDQLRQQLKDAKGSVFTALPAGQGPVVAPPPAMTRSVIDAGVGIFLDIANLAGTVRQQWGGALDYRALLGRLSANRRVVEARVYVIDKGDSGFAAFSRALREAGFQVMAKHPKTFPDGTMKADWDVGMVVDMLTLASKFNCVILGTGDGDFVPAVRALKNRGVRVEVLGVRSRMAQELFSAADQVFEIDATFLTERDPH